MHVPRQDWKTKLQLVFAWAFVSVPLVWGFLQTLQDAMLLIH
jgi:hypothetical protein